MHMAEVDCPDCVQLDASRQARTELHDGHAIPAADDVTVPVLVELVERLERAVAEAREVLEQLGAVAVKQDVMTPGEVAEYFGITPKTLRSWVKDERLRCIDLPSGHRRYLRAEVESYFESFSIPTLRHGAKDDDD
jgi:excisionase family DNA binding protein